MYPGDYARKHPDRAAFIMASSGETVTYAELEARANRLAHLLYDAGLRRLNISLDAMNAETFKLISRRGSRWMSLARWS